MGCCQVKDLRNENYNLKNENMEYRRKCQIKGDLLKDILDAAKNSSEYNINVDQDQDSQASDFIKSLRKKESDKKSINDIDSIYKKYKEGNYNPNNDKDLEKGLEDKETIFSRAKMNITISLKGESLKLGVNSHNYITIVLGRLYHDYPNKMKEFEGKKLYYNNKALELSKKLEDMNIKDGEVLELK